MIKVVLCARNAQKKLCASGRQAPSIVHHAEIYLEGEMIICPYMNINLLFVGGASIFARFLS